jgi:hypothetical protein
MVEDWKTGLYECCKSADGIFIRKKSLNIYYKKRFIDLGESTIKRDLKYRENNGPSFDYPVLVKSWRLDPVTKKDSDIHDEPPSGRKMSIQEARRILGLTPDRPKSGMTYYVIEERGGSIRKIDGKNVREK